MVSFKGKSTAIGVVADNSRGTKNTSIRDFKVYSDLEKTKVRGVDENALITAAKSSMALRKSLPVKKGNLPTDFAHIMKVCDENLRQSMNKRQDSVNAKSGRRVLADVSNLKNNVSRTAVNTGSKAVKIHNGKNQCMPRIAAGQCTTGASMSSRKLVMGTSKTVQKIRTEVYHTSKKVDSRNIKVFPGSQKTKGPGHDSFGIDGRKIVRRPLVITRKSLPVFERSSQIGSNGSVFERSSQIDSNGLKGNGRSSERGGVKLDKIKVGRKAVTNVSITRTSLQKSRASDSFPSAVSLGQSIIDTGGTSGKSVEVKISSNSKEIMLTKMATSKYSRRQSFTSCLLAKSEVLRDCSEVVKKENLPSIDDKQNHLEVAEYVEDIYEYYWVMEAQYPSISNYMTFQKDITPKMRGILVNWLIEVHLKFELMQETLFLMVALFDRFLSVVPIERNEMQLVGLTALLLASKYEDFWHPKIKELLSISSGSYTRDQMLAMEKLILKKLMFCLNTPTSYVFMLRFLKAAQSDRKMEHLAFYLTELCLTEYEALNYKTSLLCASAIYVARCTLQISPAWSPLLCKHTHYEESELRDCADMILRFHKASGKGSLKVTYDKYMLPDQSCVARIKALSRLPH